MCDGALDIVFGENFVELNRGGELLNKGIGWLGQSGAGEFFFVALSHGVRFVIKLSMVTL